MERAISAKTWDGFASMKCVRMKWRAANHPRSMTDFADRRNPTKIGRRVHSFAVMEEKPGGGAAP